MGFMGSIVENHATARLTRLFRKSLMRSQKQHDLSEAAQLKEFEKIVSTMSESAERIGANRNKVMHIQTRLSGLAGLAK